MLRLLTIIFSAVVFSVIIFGIAYLYIQRSQSTRDYPPAPPIPAAKP